MKTLYEKFNFIHRAIILHVILTYTTFHWKVTFDLTLTYKRFVRTPKKSLFMYIYILYISVYTLFIMYYAPGYVRLDHANKNLIIGKKNHINWTVFKIDESHERLNMFSWQISYRIAKGSNKNRGWYKNFLIVHIS